MIILLRNLFKATLFLSLLFLLSMKAKAQNGDFENALKITFLSWASGSTKISYERAFPGCRQSSEICASMIGAGYDKYKNKPLGFTVRYSHKFFVAGYNEEKPLMGFYIRPEVMYSHYDYTHSKTNLRTPTRMGAVMATFGYQFCVSRFIADAWVGGGYCFGKSAETGYYHGFQTFKWFGKYSDNIALSFSVRLGVLF